MGLCTADWCSNCRRAVPVDVVAPNVTPCSKTKRLTKIENKHFREMKSFEFINIFLNFTSSNTEKVAFVFRIYCLGK